MQSLADLGMEYGEAEAYCQRHQCVCGGRLVVATMPSGPAGVQQGIRCCEDKNHTGFSKEGGRHPMANEAALVQYQGSLALSREGAEFILTTIWPDAPKTEVLKAALMCRDYGLNPLMKHVYLIPYKGQQGTTWSIVLGIGAKRLIARGRRNEHPYSYLDGPRMMSALEQEAIFGEKSTTDWVAMTIIGCKDQKFPGYGRWPKAATVKGADKGNTGQNMAMIRSESAALQKFNPGGFGNASPDVVDESFEASLQYNAIESTARVVDDETGEITTPPADQKPTPQSLRRIAQAATTAAAQMEAPSPAAPPNATAAQTPTAAKATLQQLGAIRGLCDRQKIPIASILEPLQVGALELLTFSQAADLIARLQPKGKALPPPTQAQPPLTAEGQAAEDFDNMHQEA